MLVDIGMTNKYHSMNRHDFHCHRWNFYFLFKKDNIFDQGAKICNNFRSIFRHITSKNKFNTFLKYHLLSKSLLYMCSYDLTPIY